MDEDELSDEQILELLLEAEKDRDWIQERYDELKKDYADNYIIVHDQKVISYNKDIDKLLDSTEIPEWYVCEYILPNDVAMLL